MKKHESRVLNDGETYNFISLYNVSLCSYPQRGYINYVDSDNFLHNLNGPSIKHKDCDYGTYWIHGKRYFKHREWEIEANRLLMLGEL